MRKSCGQVVHNLRTVSRQLIGLRTVSLTSPTCPVDFYLTYTSSKPYFVLGLVHRFFVHLTEVADRLMPIIHMTNKDKYKYKLRIKL